MAAADDAHLLAQMLDERYRRVALNYAQSLLLMNFLPVQ